MSKVFKTIKIIFILFLISLFLVMIGLNYYQFNEIARLNQIFENTQRNLNQNVADKEFTIQNLEESFLTLNKELDGYKAQARELQQELTQLLDNGKGTIKGSVVGFVNEGQMNNQTQLVCAQSIKNQFITFCTTTSTIHQDYTLDIPAGEYVVFSKLYNGSATVGDSKGIYSNYVKCISDVKSEINCIRDELSKEPSIVKIDNGKTLQKINPVDWM
jgi:hypothetical protein